MTLSRSRARCLGGFVPGLLVLVGFVLLPALQAAARPLPLNDRGHGRPRDLQKQVLRKIDQEPPRVRLTAPERVDRPRFSVEVDAADESGVASVMISLDGTVVTGRTDPPYRFELSAPGLPVRVKATVTDTHGNSASAQAIVQGPSTSCPCPEIYAPVCGVDGRTYGNACEARCAGVEIAHDGACEEPGVCGVRGGVRCGEGQFCELAPGTCGTADQGGECRDRPQVCPRNFEPVCGCDNKTYPNDCARQAAGVSLAHPGSCDTTGCGGVQGATCGEGSFCELPAGTCDDTQMGVCAEKPDACILGLYAPVCGCDGVTYNNDCERRSAGVSLQHVGSCEGMICGGRIMRPFDCPAGQYCELPPGSCFSDGEGQCEPRPRTCPLRPITPADAVCGCDGKTYGDDCERRMAGVPLAHPGACEEPAMCGGIAGLRCADGQICDQRDPTCATADLAGQCVPRPRACAKVYAPVCGCDGRTYANDCERLRAGVVLAHPGECDTVCGPPPADLLACRDDADCVLVDGLGCCGCSMGGRQGAVNRTKRGDLMRYRSRCCHGIGCIAMDACRDDLAPACVDGVCQALPVPGQP